MQLESWVCSDSTEANASLLKVAVSRYFFIGCFIWQKRIKFALSTVVRLSQESLRSALNNSLTIEIVRVISRPVQTHRADISDIP